MGKKKQYQEPSFETVTVNGSPFVVETPSRWGYGFERHGAKWRAYKTGAALTYLSPERGEELHSAVAKIREALAAEVNSAIRSRGKS